jgi:predicted TIM-barrel fold metal-dependent hydrolase
MAKNGFKVFDSDMHLVEPADLWERYIDPAYKDRAPKGLSRHPRDLGVQVAGHTFPAENRSYTHAITPIMTQQMDIYAESETQGWDSASQVKAMDNEGIDLAVLFPSRGLFTLGTGDLEPGLATAISRAYNDWLAEFCADGSGRLFGAGMIPPHDIDGAIHEARRAVHELGFKTVFVRPNLVHGRNWHDTYYDPLWTEIEKLGVPLSFHEGGRVDLPQPGDNFETHMLYHTCTHSMAMMLAAVDVVGGGVCERFPGLTMAFLEGNCSWAPWLLWRLDEHWEMSAAYDHPDLKIAPSEYFRRQCYLSVECDEEPAEMVTRYGLEDRIVFSTDYPHADSKYPKSVDRFLRMPLTDQTKRKFLWDNCAKLYGLEG